MKCLFDVVVHKRLKSTANDFLRSLFDDSPNEQPRLFQAEVAWCIVPLRPLLNCPYMFFALFCCCRLSWYIQFFCYRCYLTNHPASSGPKECFIPLWLDMIWAYLGQTQPPAKRTCLWYCLSLSWCPKHLAFFYLICSHGLCQTEDGFVWTSDLQQCPGHVWMGTQCPGPGSSGDLRRPQETSGSTGRFRLHWTGKSYTDCIAIVMEEYSIYIYAYSLVCLIIFMIIYACYMYEYIYIINI